MTRTHARNILIAVAIAVSFVAPDRAQERAQPGLEAVYDLGAFIQDRNGDDIPDFVDAAIVLGESPTIAELAAAADVAARFGFETMAMNLPLARDPGRAVGVVAIGDAGLARADVSAAEIPGARPAAGEGLVWLTQAQGRPVVAVLGGDAAGVRAAASAFAGKLPYLGQLKAATLRTVADDVAATLADSNVAAAAVRPLAVRVISGAAEFERVTVRAEVESAAAVAAARRALARPRVPAAPKPAGEVPAEKAVTVPLSYPGAKVVEVQLAAAGATPITVTLPRVGEPEPSDLPPARRPAGSAKEGLDLSSLYSNEGLLGDTDSNLIPDRLEAIISPADASQPGVVDLAARIGLESTGVSLPILIPPDQLGKPDAQPTLVLVGESHPVAADLAKSKKLRVPALESGQGSLQIVRKAFGEKSAVVISGDQAGTRRALEHFSERLPHVWERGKDRTTLDGIENDVRRFFAGRTPAGQATTAIYKLDQLAAKLKGRALEFAHVRVHVEDAEQGLDEYVRRRIAPVLQAAALDVTVEDMDVQRASPLVDERFEVPSEVDDFWASLRREVLPKLKKKQPVQIEARLSEPPEVRDRLEQEATAELIKAGAAVEGTSVVVLSAYKQGYSWLHDKVRPALAGKPLRNITIRFAEAGPPDEWKQQAMFTPTRWLLELFPIDEILARELKLEIGQITLEKMPVGSPTYEVVATSADGTEILRERFEPKLVLRSYFDRFPDYEKVRVTTGWITAAQQGRLLVDRRIVTDLERFWDAFQARTFAPMYDHVMALGEGKPKPEHAPFFGELTVEVTLSEPNYMLGVDKEQIASLDALHEDIYFATLHFFDVLGRYTRGRPLEYPGRVIPVMHPKADGKPGHASIRLTGFRAPTSSVLIDYLEKGGARGQLKLEVPKVAVERPAADAAVVRQGRDGIETLTLRMKVDSERDEREALIVRAREDRVDAQVMSAEQAGAMLDHLSGLREAGLYRDALAYHHLGTLQLEAYWSYAKPDEAMTTFSLPANGQPEPFPDIQTLHVAADPRRTDAPLVQWETPIPPPEAYQILATMASRFKEATTYKLGESYLGKDVWAMDVMPPIEASHWSQAKATTFKPTVVYSARQHANEVSSTSHTLKLAELLLTDPAWRRKLNRVNVVFHPITNPDGAQLAYDLYKVTPDFMLHAGYLGSLGVDVTNQQWENDPIYPESRFRADLWRQWLPDIFLNPHGYPSHEWVQVFSEYAGWVRNRVTESRDWWGMRGWFTPGFGYLDDPKHPRHKDAAFEIRDRFSKAVHAAPAVRALNERAYARYKRYGHAFDQENFKLDFTNDVLIYSAIKGAKASATSSDFMTRNPNVTIWTGSTEAPDETAYGEWMELVATAGLQWDKALLDYLVESDFRIERKEDAFHGGVSLSINRPRPPKTPEEKEKDPTTTTSGGAR